MPAGVRGAEVNITPYGQFQSCRRVKSQLNALRAWGLLDFWSNLCSSLANRWFHFFCDLSSEFFLRWTDILNDCNFTFSFLWAYSVWYARFVVNITVAVRLYKLTFQFPSQNRKLAPALLYFWWSASLSWELILGWLRYYYWAFIIYQKRYCHKGETWTTQCFDSHHYPIGCLHWQ